MKRGITASLQWIIALGVMGLVITLVRGLPESVQAQMMSPSPSPSGMTQTTTPTPAPMTAPSPSSTPALSPYPSPDEMGACFVPNSRGCENGTTRKVCEEELGGVFYVSSRCPNKGYRQCYGGTAIHAEERFAVSDCHKKQYYEIMNEFQTRFRDSMIEECRMMGELGQCVWGGTYVGPGITSVEISPVDGTTCYVTGEVWYSCVKS